MSALDTDPAAESLIGPEDALAPEPAPRRTRSAVERVARNGKVQIGAVLIAIEVAAALLAPWIVPHPPDAIDPSFAYAPPGEGYWAGGDGFGRDVLSRVIYGGRVSLAVGVAATALGALVGIPLGAASGYFGGWTDRIAARLIDVLLPFPVVLVAMLTTLLLGPGLVGVTVAVGLVLAPFFARVLRGAVLAVTPRQFVEAARGIGMSHRGILARHVLPHCLGPILIMAALSVAFSILAEASLGFLGLGVPPPTPSWGADLQGALKVLELAPWAALAPGVAITVSVFGFNLLGDGVRDALQAGDRFL